MMDWISVRDNRSVLITEVKRSSTREASNNSGGEVHSFVTTGETYRMLEYNEIFQMSEKMEILFDSMDDNKER